MYVTESSVWKKCSWFLSDCNENCNVKTDFTEKRQYKFSWKYSQWDLNCSIRTGGRTWNMSWLSELRCQYTRQLGAVLAVTVMDCKQPRGEIKSNRISRLKCLCLSSVPNFFFFFFSIFLNFFFWSVFLCLIFGQANPQVNRLSPHYAFVWHIISKLIRDV